MPPKAVAALGHRMERLPERVSESRTIPLGTYRGLAYGLCLHPLGGMEAYLDGNVTRRAELRGGAGPRAVLNALDRLAAGYSLESERCQQDKAVAEGQLADYQSRVGAGFQHADFGGLAPAEEEPTAKPGNGRNKPGRKPGRKHGRQAAAQTATQPAPAPAAPADVFAHIEAIKAAVSQLGADQVKRIVGLFG